MLSTLDQGCAIVRLLTSDFTDDWRQGVELWRALGQPLLLCDDQLLVRQVLSLTAAWVLPPEHRVTVDCIGMVARLYGIPIATVGSIGGRYDVRPPAPWKIRPAGRAVTEQ